MSDIYIMILISILDSLNSPTKSRLSEINFVFIICEVAWPHKRKRRKSPAIACRCHSWLVFKMQISCMSNRYDMLTDKPTCFTYANVYITQRNCN